MTKEKQKEWEEYSMVADFYCTLTFGDRIKVEDGRIGTICWHHLDGWGGAWGEKDFPDIDLGARGGFSDEIPAPEFMLREKEVESVLRKSQPGIECVGERYLLIRKAESK